MIWYERVGKLIYPKAFFSIPSEKNIYLTFDDGPTPGVTPRVLEVLSTFNVKATFFCLGKNVEAFPEIYDEILKDGHSVGNHGYNHLNGLNTSTQEYIDNVIKAEDFIKTNLFRPPYGRMKLSQANQISNRYKIIMWSILTKDYNQKQSVPRIIRRTVTDLTPGAIIVFHDSLKAEKQMMNALPKVIESVITSGYSLEKILF